MPPVEVFKGSKNYWRLRTNVDFHIFEHAEDDVMEIICFHPALHTEAPRLYLSISKYRHMLEISEKLEDMLCKKRGELSKSRLRLTPAELVTAVIRETIVNFILLRIQVIIENTDEGFNITMIPLVGDTVAENGQLEQLVPQPESVKHHIIPRGGRLQSSQAFGKSMRELRIDSGMLRQASTKAEKIINLQNLAVEGFKGVMDMAKIYSDEMSSARKRFIRAVRRVMAQNAVARCKQRLEEIRQFEIEREKQELRINKLGCTLAPIAAPSRRPLSGGGSSQQPPLLQLWAAAAAAQKTVGSARPTSAAPIRLVATRAAIAATAKAAAEEAAKAKAAAAAAATRALEEASKAAGKTASKFSTMKSPTSVASKFPTINKQTNFGRNYSAGNSVFSREGLQRQQQQHGIPATQGAQSGEGVRSPGVNPQPVLVQAANVTLEVGRPKTGRLLCSKSLTSIPEKPTMWHHHFDDTVVATVPLLRPFPKSIHADVDANPAPPLVKQPAAAWENI